MNRTELKKKAAKDKKLRKMEERVKLIAAGAQMPYLEGDKYFEFQEECCTCIGNFICGILFYFDLNSDSLITRPNSFSELKSPKSTAKLIIRSIEWQNQQDNP